MHERRTTHGKAAPRTGLLNAIPSRPTAGGGFVHTKRTARHQKDRSTTEGSNSLSPVTSHAREGVKPLRGFPSWA